MTAPWHTTLQKKGIREKKKKKKGRKKRFPRLRELPSIAVYIQRAPDSHHPRLVHTSYSVSRLTKNKITLYRAHNRPQWLPQPA
jgi:hypothetical protein